MHHGSKPHLGTLEKLSDFIAAIKIPYRAADDRSRTIPGVIPKLYLGIDRYLGPIDSSPNMWVNRGYELNNGHKIN